MKSKRVPILVVLLLLVPAVAHAAPSSFDALRSKGWIWAYLGVFAAGVGTDLTPCVYPMIPIVLGIFGAKQATSRLRAIALVSTYVLGMGLTYGALGVGVALTGKAFGTILANPWVVIPIVVFYAALAASMFGAFELNLPSGLQAKLSSVGGAGYGGAFAMGLVGGLTAAPCTGPILMGLLAFVATTRNLTFGFTLLFTYAVGMGVLFFAIGVFAMRLPKSGGWMEAVKSVGGIALLVVGVYFLRPIWPLMRRLVVPSGAFLAVMIGVAAVGVLIGAVHLSFHDRPAVKLRKGLGVTLAFAGSVGIVNWTLTPKRELPWLTDQAVALAQAARRHAPMVVDVGAEWCKPCKKLETDVFADPAVYDEITAHFVPLKIDVDKMTAAEKTRWHIPDQPSLPTVILAPPRGQQRVLYGEKLDAQEFLRDLRSIE